MRELLARASRRDVEGMTALLTDDVVLDVPFREPPLRFAGRGQVGEVLAAFIGNDDSRFRSLVYTVDDVVVDPRRAVVVAQYRSDAVVRASGRSWGNTYVGRFDLRDGRVARWVEWSNPTVAASDAG